MKRARLDASEAAGTDAELRARPIASDICVNVCIHICINLCINKAASSPDTCGSNTAVCADKSAGSHHSISVTTIDDGGLVATTTEIFKFRTYTEAQWRISCDTTEIFQFRTYTEAQKQFRTKAGTLMPQKRRSETRNSERTRAAARSLPSRTWRNQ